MPITERPVLVTGATGFIAAELVKQLLEDGYRVRGTTRSVEKCEADGYLTGLPGASERLELVEADLLEPGAYDQAVVGCDYVMHTASPYVLNVDDPQRDLVDPAVNGTLSVLQAAARDGQVKRVVLTSSFAAVAGHASDHVWTEADWNTTSTLETGSYSYSKTMAERAAWDFVETNDVSFDLVVINPSGVIGPSIVDRVNQSHQFFVDASRGEFPGIIDLAFAFVDVRDVAKAHILAMENPEASGRYLTSASSASFRHLMDLAKANGYGEKYKLPTLALDNAFGSAIVRLALVFQPKGTRDFLKTALGKEYVLDTSKIENELAMEWRDVDETVVDALNDLEAWGHLGK